MKGYNGQHNRVNLRKLNRKITSEIHSTAEKMFNINDAYRYKSDKLTLCQQQHHLASLGCVRRCRGNTN